MTTRLVLAGLLFVACSKNTAPADKPAGITPSANPAPAAPTPPPPAPTPPPAAEKEKVEEMGAVPDAKQTIGGKIVLPAARKNDVKKGDTIFLIARRTGMPGPPLAVQRLQAGDFPLAFSLSSRDSMVPGVPFEGEVSITARVDKDGDAMTRRKGDVFGQIAKAKIGTQDLVLPLDTLQAEDVTLGGMGGPRPGMPPGHP
jgi:cytochrome c-type biogenesis protein CcmH